MTTRLEELVPASHPLRPIGAWLAEALAGMNAKVSATYESDIIGGRPSIASERPMRAELLQAHCNMRSGSRW